MANFTVLEKKVYRDKPCEAGFGCWKCVSDYTSSKGTELFEVNSEVAGCDRYDNYMVRFSPDNGANWGDESLTLRRKELGRGYVQRICEFYQGLDPHSDTVLRFYDSGVNSDNNLMSEAEKAELNAKGVDYKESYTDEGLEEFSHNASGVCSYSTDGGRTFSGEINLKKVFADSGMGSCFPLFSCQHLTPLPDGSLCITAYDAEGKGGAGIIKLKIDNGNFNWDAKLIGKSEYVPGVFLNEGSTALLPDGRLVVMFRCDPRAGGREVKRKWIAVSEDGGESWSKLTEWCYTDGTPVISPGSQPRLFCNPDGRLFFIGTIAECEDFDAWTGRNTLTMMEIDTATLCAKPDSRIAVDCRQPEDHPYVAISNFSTLFDRVSGNLHIFAPRAYNRAVELADSILMKYTIGF